MLSKVIDFILCLVIGFAVWGCVVLVIYLLWFLLISLLG